MPSCRIHAEDQYQQRGHQQREYAKTVASEIAEFFAHDRRTWGESKPQAIGAIVYRRDRADSSTGGAAVFTSSCTTIYCPPYRGDTRWPRSLEFAFAPGGAIVRKEFRYLTRNGFAYLTLLMPRC